MEFARQNYRRSGLKRTNVFFEKKRKKQDLKIGSKSFANFMDKKT